MLSPASLLVSSPAAVLTGVLKESPTPACDRSGSQAPVSRCRAAGDWLLLALAVYLLVAAVSIIGLGFKSAVGERATGLFDAVGNPITGLVVGLLATALVQSSSSVTSIIVGLVAGGLPVPLAVPMVMGANIGTSVTNTLVSLTHITDRSQFRRAFAAATVLDMFNLLAVLILFPLELPFHPLESISLHVAELLRGRSGIDPGAFNLVDWAVRPLRQLTLPLDTLFSSWGAGLLRIALGVSLVFFSVVAIGKLLKRIMLQRAGTMLTAAIGRGPLAGVFSGMLATVLFQSSSTTTSLIVPLAGNGLLTLRQVYPFTLGANVGTCVTALMAATAITGESAVAALEIALVHLLFNVFGVLAIFGTPALRSLPMVAAEWLAELAVWNRLVAMVYVLGGFFLIPAALIGLTSLWR